MIVYYRYGPSGDVHRAGDCHHSPSTEPSDNPLRGPVADLILLRQVFRAMFNDPRRACSRNQVVLHLWETAMGYQELAADSQSYTHSTQ